MNMSNLGVSINSKGWNVEVYKRREEKRRQDKTREKTLYLNCTVQGCPADIQSQDGSYSCLQSNRSALTRLLDSCHPLKIEGSG